MINDKRKNLVIVTMITIIVIVLGVLGASYAYFQGSIAGNGLSNIKTIANSLDNLVFTPGSDITITANQSNFGSGSGNRSGSTTSTVKLTARNDASSTHYYRIYLLISENTFVYTYGTTPELPLTVTKNGTTVINAMDVTTTKGVIDIPTVSGGSSLKQPITASAGSTTTDTWVATVTFVNLNSNQNGNAGKGFKAVLFINDAPQLPSGYQEVQYIQNTGLEYIDTGYILDYNSSFNVDIDYGPTVTGYRYCLASSYNKSPHTSIEVYSDNKIRYYYNNSTVDYKMGVSLANTRNVSSIVYTQSSSKYSIYLNGVSYNGSSFSTLGIDGGSLLLFVDQAKRFSTFNHPLRMYKVRIVSNNRIERNLVPCKRTSDSVVGMYDTVNDVFYTNVGTGTFTAGSNVT